MISKTKDMLQYAAVIAAVVGSFLLAAFSRSIWGKIPALIFGLIAVAGLVYAGWKWGSEDRDDFLTWVIFWGGDDEKLE